MVVATLFGSSGCSLASAWTEALEQAYRGMVRYRGGVLVRYHPLEICNPNGAQEAFARYKYWKDRGLPVSILWDEKQSGETVPDAFEFKLEGEGPCDTDLVICTRNRRYLVSLTNLRADQRNTQLRVQLKGEDMSRWEVRPVFGSPVGARRSADNLICQTALKPLASAVFELKCTTP